VDAIVTPLEMAAIDAAAPEPVDVLIERAAAAVAMQALEMLDGAYGKRVVVLAGKGNNGADGRGAARRLARRGVRCKVIDTQDAPAQLPRADLVIDAAYGTGFKGEYFAPALFDASVPVLAVDIPSGIDGLTGMVSGRALKAERTVTFGAYKPGLLLGDGPGYCGEVVVADIGLDTSGVDRRLLGPNDIMSWLTKRPRDSHKWRQAVWVIGGSAGMLGAASLTAHAAQRSGASYVRISVPGETASGAPIEAVEVALSGDGWASEVLRDEHRFKALAVGPGLGLDPVTQREVRNLIAQGTLPVVVDGDGLRALGLEAREVIASRPENSGAVVLTPHDGELEALVAHPPGPDRFREIGELAEELGAVILAKGPTTIVAGPDGKIFASNSADQRLATAGTGDVLTGIITALLAQSIPAMEAAGAASILHGHAGALTYEYGMVASDLVEKIPAAFASITGGQIATHNACCRGHDN